MKIAAFILNLLTGIGEIIGAIPLLIGGITGSALLGSVGAAAEAGAFGVGFIFFAILLLARGIVAIIMGAKIFKANKEGTTVSTAFGVCNLIFCNLISGILLLVDTSQNK